MKTGLASDRMLGDIQMTIQIGKLGSIVLSAFVMAGTAGAADLRVATPPPPAFNWSGCYVGGFVGGARSDGDMTILKMSAARFGTSDG